MFEKQPMTSDPRLWLIMVAARNGGISTPWMVTSGTFRD